MAIRCDEVRALLGPAGAPAPLSDDRAEQVAEHLDQCPDCSEQLSRRIGEAVEGVPVERGPSIQEVRRLARLDRRQSFFLRFAAAAAALLAVLGTGWAMLRDQPPPTTAHSKSPPVAVIDEAIPDPLKIADLSEADRRLIRSESVLILYLQFCLSCINEPNEDDKAEFLIRSLLIFREVRGTMKTRYAATPMPDVETVTLEALRTAVQTLRASPLPSVTLLPSKINAFRFPKEGEWQVDHMLGAKQWRFTLATLPSTLNFTYLKEALGADDALMTRIEDTLWRGEYVKIPKKIDEKDATLVPKVKEAVLPLLTPRQQKIYRKIMETP